MLDGQAPSQEAAVNATTVPPPPAVPGQPAAAPAKPHPAEYTVTPDAVLEDLLTRFEIAQTQVTEAEQVRDTLDAAIKAKLTALVPPGTAVINVPAGRYRKARRLGWNTPRKFDRAVFDKAYPGLYEQFMIWGTASWGWRKAGG